MYKRVVLKLSGEALAGKTTKNFDDGTIEKIVTQIKKIVEKEIEVCIVVGGGNFWRGRISNQFIDRTKSDQIGMLATVMNSIYLGSFFAKEGLSSVVMTPFEIGNITEVFSKEKAQEYLTQKKVIIFAGGIGHPFFSTDTITALRASELNADTILFAKNIDGVYDSDPDLNNKAKKLSSISCKEIIEKGLKVIDIAAASLCYEQKIPIIIFGLLEEDSIIKAAMGEKMGTIVTV